MHILFIQITHHSFLWHKISTISVIRSSPWKMLWKSVVLETLKKSERMINDVLCKILELNKLSFSLLNFDLQFHHKVYSFTSIFQGFCLFSGTIVARNTFQGTVLWDSIKKIKCTTNNLPKHKKLKMKFFSLKSKCLFASDVRYNR